MVLASSQANAQQAASTGGRSLLPLVLGVKRKKWRDTDEAMEIDADFQNARKAVLLRDEHRCRFCGFNLPRYLQAHHLNDDHSNHKADNLVTACTWCHGCFHIGHRGLHQLGVLAIHPEWPAKDLPEQWQLHHLVRSLMIVPEPYVPVAQDLIDFIYGECTNAITAWLPTADPTWLGDRLLELDEDQYRNRGTFLKGIRLLPQFGPPEGGMSAATANAWKKESEVRDYWNKESLNRVGNNWGAYRIKK